jgi:peptidoglycan LD-endopeptidase LytH
MVDVAKKQGIPTEGGPAGSKRMPRDHLSFVIRKACSPVLLLILASGCARSRSVASTGAEPTRPVSETAEKRPPPDPVVLRLAERGLMVPVDGVVPSRVSDSFAASRGDRQHTAVDILAPRGTAVLSADSGKVWKMRSNVLGGRTVYVIDLAEEFVHYYAHLDGYLQGLVEGQLVGPGDILGYVGTTGNAPPSTPHLHYQILRYRGNGKWWDGDPVNPHPLLRREGKAIIR